MVHAIFHLFLFDFFSQDKSAPPVCALPNPMAKAAVDLIGDLDFPIGLIFRLLRSNFSFSEMDYCCPPHNSIFVYLLLKQPSEF